MTGTDTNGQGPATAVAGPSARLTQLSEAVVGRRHEVELLMAALDGGAVDGELVLTELRRHALAPIQRFFDGLRAGRYDGHLEASTAVRVANLLRYASGAVPLDAYQLDHGKVGTPSVLVEDLTAALTHAIDELTRPIDAIKHQAKTVTVGISRTDESLLEVALGLLAAERDLISARGLTLVGVSLTNLVDAGGAQMELPLGREAELDSAVDAVRDRFGSGLLTRGSLVGQRVEESLPLLREG